MREGLLARTPRGRIAMPAAWEHLGLVPPEHAAFRDTAVRQALGDQDSPQQ